MTLPMTMTMTIDDDDDNDDADNDEKYNDAGEDNDDVDDNLDDDNNDDDNDINIGVQVNKRGLRLPQTAYGKVQSSRRGSTDLEVHEHHLHKLCQVIVICDVLHPTIRS